MTRAHNLYGGCNFVIVWHLVADKYKNGTWPVILDEAFFRLWYEFRLISNYPTGLPTDNELENGILLAFEAATADNSNHIPGITAPFRCGPKAWTWTAALADRSPPQGARKQDALCL